MANVKEMNGRSVECVKSNACFDYNALPSPAAEFLKAQAHRIRRQAAISIIHIGKDLIAAKHYLSHGTFLSWVEAEVDIPARTAQAYMQVAQWAARKRATVASLPPSILYFLSAPSTPESYVDEILRRIESGERIAFPTMREELRCLRESRRGGNPNSGSPMRGGAQLDQRTWPITGDVEAKVTLQRAVAILARGLPPEDFAEVRDILTSKTVLEAPELAKKIAAAFSAGSGSEPNVYDGLQRCSVAAETQVGV